jgi:siroheme synthase-like protein
VLLDLRQRPVVVVGGGEPAERRVRALLDAGALVTVIAPRLSPGLEDLAAAERIVWLDRSFRPGDLAGGARLAFAQRLDPAVNRAIYAEAEERGLFVNVEDDVANCSFISPAVARQGDLLIAISTAGRAPALAVRVREELEHRFGPEYAALLELAGRLRRPLAAAVPDFAERRRRWYRFVDSRALALLRDDRVREAEELAISIMGVEPEPRQTDAYPAPASPRTAVSVN